jgi:hypothetical protein
MKIEIEHEGSCLGATGEPGRLIVRDALAKCRRCPGSLEGRALHPPGRVTLDASFKRGGAFRTLGWGTHARASRAASYSSVFTLSPILTGERAHHGEILREATKLVDAGKIMPRLDPAPFQPANNLGRRMPRLKAASPPTRSFSMLVRTLTRES